jgi:sugar phosphate isomerase/epimerase
MNMNRRSFFSLSAVAGVASALPQGVSAAVSLPEPEKPARLRLSCQEGVAPGNSLKEKLDFMEENGFEGIEPGGSGLGKRVEEFQKALEGRKIKVSAICAGFEGVPISDKEEERQKAIKSIKEILTAAGALGSTGMIIVPAFNGQTKLGHWESREMLLKILPELADHAVQAKTRLLLEPLNRKEAHFLRQVADAAAICKDVSHPGVCLMGDFWHMTWEEPCDMAAFLAGAKYLHHVHMASRKTRQMPGEDEGDNYVTGMKGLKLIGYQDFVSLECGSKGDRKKTIPAAVKLIRDNWAQA